MDEQVMTWAMQRPEQWETGGKCDAFMWGGGRHGQLAETGRGVNVPTVTKSFSSAQQIVCGQNCTFVLQTNGTILACGEGSYGRLGMGNSDDLLVLTPIAALQGMYLSVRSPSVSLSVCLSRRPSVHLSVCQSVCLSVSLCICLSVCLPSCMSLIVKPDLFTLKH